MEQKHYALRNVHDDEKLARLFFDHMSAMTEEGLNSKGDIAAELAYRDREIDRLTTMLTDRAVEETYITDIGIKNGGLNIDLDGGAARLLAEAFAEQFLESGAENYLEMKFGSTKIPDREIVVTIQRVSGETPHQKRVVAEQQLEKYKAFHESVTCYFAEGVEFMNKIELYDAFKKEWQKALHL